ncbi:Voltage-gated potassium channel Kch [Paraliobacillus sp. PM-2]|uniref:potassium channel family protein n=1 Tax=Paraliobacillus sp. PM-2 TaxID=1462524 RepID=UPI00061BA075|nr:potassium channel family protein [Paraliobacillus sp. PM-2]CQR48180.1 Voltage-gated potassium channel Kch [Paraliobacillus sp. PM-2]
MYVIRKIIKKMIKIQNSILFLSSILLVVITSYLISFVENETFPTFFDGFWWVMTTVTTVGYGDYSPVTLSGRLIAIFLYIFGIGIIGVVIGKVVDGLAIFRRKKETGDIMYKEQAHYIIIGWSKKAAFAIKEMLETTNDIEIVIIDDLEKAPILAENIHYIRGNASETATLEKANIHKAQSVLVFADDMIEDDQLTDGKTLLIASAIESIAPEVHTIVEVMDEEHLKNFAYMNVDEFIISTETVSSLFVRSAFRKGISSVYNQLLRRTHGDDLFFIPATSKWKTYRDAFEELLDHGATLVADGDDLGINRKLDKPLPAHAQLYVICDKNTIKTIKDTIYN